MSEILDAWAMREKSVRTFFSDHPDIETVVDAQLIAVRALISGTRHSVARDYQQETLLQLWRTVYDYQEQSLFLLLSEQMDGAFALLRMASELARDIARMGEDRVNFEMWMAKSTVRRKPVYKNTFKFKEEDKIEKRVWDLYTMFSEFGVHGHLTSQSLSQKIGDSPSGEFVILGIKEAEVIRQLSLWCIALVSIQQLCLKPFQVALEQSEPEVLRLFNECILATGPLIESLREVKDEDIESSR